jgi:hypothetical protein
MSGELELQGERVNSRVSTMKKPFIREIDIVGKKIAQEIPFWPEKTSVVEIARKTGMTVSSVSSRIPSIQEPYLVFQEDHDYSRIKPDFSNMEQTGEEL